MWRRKRKREQDLDDEIRSHLAIEESQRIERGESRQDARANARRQFGNVSLVKEVTREMWGSAGFEKLRQDAVYGLRFSSRMLRREFAATAMIILTLGLAIGANTTIFGLANALLLRGEAGISKPGELFDIGRTRGPILGPLSYPDYIDLRRNRDLFEGLAAYGNSVPLGLTGPQGAEGIYGSLVSANFFNLLGVRLRSGRSFLPEEDGAGATPVVIISHDLDQRLDGAKELILNGRRFTVVGVAPERFNGIRMARTDVWLPLGVQPFVSPESGSLVNRGSSWLRAAGRLRDGISMAQAQSQIVVIAAHLDEAYPLGRSKRSIQITHHTSFGAGPPVRAFVLTLMGIVILILLIACSNVSGISIVRTIARQREIAVRMAMGAGRGRVMTQLLSENLTLFAVGGLAGAVMASWMTMLLSKAIHIADPILAIDLSPDYRVAGFTFLLTVATALVFGLEPALQATRIDVATAMKEDSVSVTGRRSRVRNGLVVAQVALSFVLLVCGGLFLRTMLQASSFDPGFETRNVWAVSLNFALGGHDESQSRRFGRDLLERLSVAPGVAASLASDAPLDGSRSTRDFVVAGIEVRAGYNHVAPGYFAALGIPIAGGRDFTNADNEGAPTVAIISQSGAEKLWPGANPLGQRLGDMEIIGVAGNARTASLGFSEEPGVFYYAPLAQNYQSDQVLLIKAPEGLNPIPNVRAALSEIGPALPVLNVRPMKDVVTSGLLSQRLAAWTAGAMAVFGVLLASAGLYGITAHGVSRRSREIGIRAVLGARPGEILRLVIRESLALTGIGLVLGLAGAFALSRLIANMLFQVAPTDSTTFVASSAIIAAVATAAAFLPARRAAKLDPVNTLRQ